MNKRIKKLRRELDLTQEKFGARIGVKGNTVAQWESGRNEPPDSSLAFICREFGVMDEWLRFGTGPMYAPEPTTELDALAKKFNLKHKDYVFIEKLCKNKKLRELLIDFSLEFAQDLLSGDESPETSAFGDIHDGVPSTPEELEEMYPPVEEDKREGRLG